MTGSARDRLWHLLTSAIDMVMRPLHTLGFFYSFPRYARWSLRSSGRCLHICCDVCPSLCLSQVEPLSKQLDGSSQFWHGCFLWPILHGLHRILNEIRVSPKTRILSSETSISGLRKHVATARWPSLALPTYFDRRPSPVDHTEHPRLCTTRWARDSAHRAGLSAAAETCLKKPRRDASS